MPPEGFRIRSLKHSGSATRRVAEVRRNVGRGSWMGLGTTVRQAFLKLWEIPRLMGWKRFAGRLALWGGGIFALYLGILWVMLPSINEQTILAASQSTVITDRNGIELYRVHGEQDRTVIPGTDIPESVKQAIIAIEDRRYKERGCIDIRAFARALVSFGRLGGASTITRQLARNALDLKRENIVTRKIKELILGCQLELRYDKDQLLELYLNWIPFGQNAYGVEQASRRYFGKTAKELSLAEAAVLASLPQLPTYFSPYGRHVHTEPSPQLKRDILEGTITSTEEVDDDDVTIGLLGTMAGSGSRLVYLGGRADQVLHNMREEGFIDDKQMKEATQALRTIAFKPVRESIRAPHFVLWAREQVEKLFEDSPDRLLLEQGGLTIETTLDWELQQAAEAAVAAHKDDALKRFMANNIALVAVDSKTREVLAYVGNTDYSDETKEGKIDMAQVPRQPGSSFKPFVYAAAFRNGVGPATILWDVPTKFGDYEPQNFEGDFWGLINIRRALGGSRNIPAVKAYVLGDEEDAILALAEQMGVPTPKARKPQAGGYGAALGIGAAEVPLIEMVHGYSTIADGGAYKPLLSVRKVTDRRGILLHSPGMGAETAPEGTPVLDRRIAYELTSVLSDVGARPNEYWQSVLSVPGTQAAAKTGTSNKCLERKENTSNDPTKITACTKRKPDNVWTIGYTPTLVAGVWVGNATSEALSERADGLTVAAPIWKDFMARAMKIRKPAATTFPMPEGVVQVQTSLLSGELPTECTPVELRRSDIFLAENVPTAPDPACVRLLVDKVTGLLASDSCPEEAREERSFLVPHSIFPETYPKWEQSVVEWAKAHAPKISGTGSVILLGSGGTLPLPIAPTQKCDIRTTPGRTVKPTLTVVSPEESGVASYPTFKPKLSTTVGSSIRQIEYVIDGKTAAKVMTPPFDRSIRIPKTIEKTGAHTLRVILTDEYYNTASDDVTFTFRADTLGPSIRLNEPQDGAEIAAGTPLTIRAVSADPEGEVKYIEFYLDALLLSRDASVPYELTYAQKIAPGTHTVRAVATDLAGNEAEDEVTITVK